jgi:uncharacterized membrane protein YoaK (UPF0700 family)
MFRHRGKGRTLIHNLKLASLLSFVAGIINVSGLFALQRLTTNVTGHFAYFVDEIVRNDLGQAGMYILFIAAFLLGSFTSNVLVEIMARYNERLMNVIPVSIEIIIILYVALLPPAAVAANTGAVACLLLFAMGLQNSLVTSISGAVVRTTHLTGLFTDLGIELSQLIFYKQQAQQKKLWSSIKLRLIIICFFFLGGLAGGVGYIKAGIKVLLLGVVILVAALLYDNLKFRVIKLKRRLHNS